MQSFHASKFTMKYNGFREDFCIQEKPTLGVKTGTCYFKGFERTEKWDFGMKQRMLSSLLYLVVTTLGNLVTDAKKLMENKANQNRKPKLNRNYRKFLLGKILPEQRKFCSHS